MRLLGEVVSSPFLRKLEKNNLPRAVKTDGYSGRSNAGAGVTVHLLVFPQAAGHSSGSAAVRNNRAVIKGEANLPSMGMSAQIKAGHVLSSIPVSFRRVGDKDVECVFGHLIES